ncbi:DNA replication protein psf2 [Mycoemilia scoparia]|uniref:DNA replication complex GINS protein PSF2 n=1 Tax=Mycoemilia scoparia TaxID=417184 RepID=A0A9W8DRS0_9FUNG|nr:DNA replication protein psf2 [Mycoemilia scoparia]
MALSAHQKIAFTPAELQFLAENEPITIVPTRHIEKLELISGSYGPFNPPRKAQVPLWLAAMLKSSSYCRIVPPSWMDSENLEKICNSEEQPESRFSNLPPYYIIVASILFECAEDDIPEAQSIRRLLQDVGEIRQGKVREGLKYLNPAQLQMDNLSMAEINQIRPLFKGAFNMLSSLADLKRQAPFEADESQYSQMNTNSSLMH